MNLQDLPDIVFEKILFYLSYDQIAKCRSVSCRFNTSCSVLLNRGFLIAEKFHNKSLKAVKAKLPRRESERKNHPLSRQCDILVAVETRLSMLSMTFSKYIEANQCCFIPGKVIDEVLRVLRFVNSSTTTPPRPHDVLQELRDISSMAMEHFDEKILPKLKERMAANKPKFPCYHVSVNNGPPRTFLSSVMSYDTLRRNIFKIRIKCMKNRKQVAWLKKTVKSLKLRDNLNRKNIKKQSTKILSQNEEIKDLRKQVDEWGAKLRDFDITLSRSRDPNNKETDLDVEKEPLNAAATKRKSVPQIQGIEKKRKM